MTDPEEEARQKMYDRYWEKFRKFSTLYGTSPGPIPKYEWPKDADEWEKIKNHDAEKIWKEDVEAYARRFMGQTPKSKARKNYPSNFPQELVEALEALTDEEYGQLRMFNDEEGFIGSGLESKYGWMIKPMEKLWVFDVIDKYAKLEIDQGTKLKKEYYGPKRK